jgi:hypothetical protein
MLTPISLGMGWNGPQSIFTSTLTISYCKVLRSSSVQRLFGKEAVSKHQETRKQNVILSNILCAQLTCTGPKILGRTRRALAHLSTKISTSFSMSRLAQPVAFLRMFLYNLIFYPSKLTRYLGTQLEVSPGWIEVLHQQWWISGKQTQRGFQLGIPMEW